MEFFFINQDLFNTHDIGIVVFGANSRHMLSSRYGCQGDGGQAKAIYDAFNDSSNPANREFFDVAPFVTRFDQQDNLCEYYNKRLAKIICEYDRLGGKIYFPFADASKTDVNIGTNLAINTEVQKQVTDLYNKLEGNNN
jgi:hypothetical protein